MLIRWVNDEHKIELVNSKLERMRNIYLQGTWTIIRKIRIVQLIRKMIEEEILISGVKGMYEEGCRLLSQMENRGVRREEGVENEDTLIAELLLLKYRGEEKGLKESEVNRLRNEVSEEKSKREEAERRVEEEKRRREEAERGKEEERQRWKRREIWIITLSACLLLSTLVCMYYRSRTRYGSCYHIIRPNGGYTEIVYCCS